MSGHLESPESNEKPHPQILYSGKEKAGWEICGIQSIYCASEIMTLHTRAWVVPNGDHEFWPLLRPIIRADNFAVTIYKTSIPGI